MSSDSDPMATLPAVPLVSVVIAFYGVEDYIGEAIESVLAQSYGNYEIILVDDGGHDRSRAIVDRFVAAGNGRVRCVEHEGRVNRGLSASRNLGWKTARGDLVAFLDGDDRWMPDKLEKQVAVFQAHPGVQVCTGASLYWHEWPGSLSNRKDRLLPVGAEPNVSHPPKTLLPQLYPLGDGYAPSMNTLMVRRDVFDLTGPFEVRFRRSFEDQAFLVKAYLYTTVHILPDALDLYRQGRPGSITETELRGAARHDQNIAFYRWLASYLATLGDVARPFAAVARERLLAARKSKWLHALRRIKRRLFG